MFIRKLWDNYYVPFIKGYFEANGHFRSDDIKTGTILSYVGSSSSATFFQDSVMTSDDSHSIELKVLPNPHFAGCEPVSVQQGCRHGCDCWQEAEIKASVTFPKWFVRTGEQHSSSRWARVICLSPGSQHKEEMLADSEVAMTPEVKSVLTDGGQDGKRE